MTRCTYEQFRIMFLSCSREQEQNFTEYLRMVSLNAATKEFFIKQ